jgi:iron complex transport system substrate-binding protein
MKICSLLPGATEVVAALGLAEALVGISHECDYPPEVRNRPVMLRPTLDPEQASSSDLDRQVKTALADGRPLYQLDEELFARAQPDLVITQVLCQVCAVTPRDLRLAMDRLPRMPKVLSLNATRLEQVLAEVQRIGSTVGKEALALALSTRLRARLESIRGRTADAMPRPKVACLEWLDPLFVAGHWVPEMVTLAGGDDALGRAGAPSQRITWEQLMAAAPDVVILIPCGFSIDRTLRELERITEHPAWPDLPAVRTGRVYAFDAASYFSRPGPRLVDGVAQLAAALHPQLFGHGVPDSVRQLTGSG